MLASLLHQLLVSARRPWFERHLPEPLLREGPQGLFWWQWLAIPAAIILAYVGGKLLGWLTRQILGHIFARTQTTWDDLLLARLAAPLTAFWSVWVAWGLLPWLALEPELRRSATRGLHATSFVILFWAALRSIDLGFKFLGSFPWARANPLATGILPLGSKIARIAVIVIGAIAVLTQLGYPVASLLAGLGIGGLALALAAQKTVENLFGSVSISVDQPCRVGDFVKVDAVAGTVESIGLRSTRIRTPDRTVITIPNGKLADARIENLASRDRLRIYTTLQLVQGTRAAQMREVLAGIEGALRSHPKLHPEGLSVRFIGVNPSSLEVEVAAYLATTDWAEFTQLRQELFLEFLEVVERAGTALALPTQALVMAGGEARARPGGPDGAAR
jgi:MscS family membrane protein